MRFVAGLIAVLAAAAALGALPSLARAAEAGQLRVCADPDNMPFSNERGEGFENEIANLVAQDLGKTVVYTWWAQRRSFIRNTLYAGKCDVIMGVPPLDAVATTEPYYRSGYVFVSREDRRFAFTSIAAPELRRLRIGVHFVGDDNTRTPPAHALGDEGIVNNVVGYTIYSDYRRDAPPTQLLEAVAYGEVDVAAVWGPFAGNFAKRSPVPLRITPITATEQMRLRTFTFPISVGVRKGDDALQGQLNEVIKRREADIRAILDRYGIPRM